MSTTPELRMIDPTTLVIDTNVRLDAKADRALIQSMGVTPGSWTRGVITRQVAA